MFDSDGIGFWELVVIYIAVGFGISAVFTYLAGNSDQAIRLAIIAGIIIVILAFWEMLKNWIIKLFNS